LRSAKELGFKVPIRADGKNQTERNRNGTLYAIEVLSKFEHIICLQNDDLLVYDGRVYQYPLNNRGYGENLIRVMVKGLLGEGCLDSQRTEVVKFFRDTHRYSIEDFDNQTGKIVVENGILDMATGELEEHNPEFLATYCIPLRWNPEADTTVADEWLEWFIPDPETRWYLQKYTGCTIAGVKDLQLLLILYGELGLNGKDTFLDILRAMLGRLAWTTPPGTLLEDKFNSNKNFSLAFVRGCKLLIASETERNVYLSESYIKCSQEVLSVPELRTAGKR